MDSEEIKARYMEQYNKLVQQYENSDIRDIIDATNKAIKGSDMKKVNEGYNKILTWNTFVANIEGARMSLDAQFSYWRLPSPTIFSIVFDENEKKWVFKGEGD